MNIFLLFHFFCFSSSSLRFLLFICFVSMWVMTACVYVCMYGSVCTVRGQRTALGSQVSPLLCESWKIELRSSGCAQVPSLPESSQRFHFLTLTCASVPTQVSMNLHEPISYPAQVAFNHALFRLVHT